MHLHPRVYWFVVNAATCAQHQLESSAKLTYCEYGLWKYPFIINTHVVLL